MYGLGGDKVVRISFQNDVEALTLLKMIVHHPYGVELQQAIQFTSREGLELDIGQNLEKWITMLTDVFYSFLLEEKLSQVLEQIIKQKFYFNEQDEIDHILQFAASIIEGEKNRSKEPLFSEEKHWIKKGLHPILTEKKSFSFDSFTTFRLKSFYQSLERYAMQAIDEYKLEQDYQNFISILRDVLHKREPRISYLHLVYRDAFHFYDHSFRKLERYEITDMIDRHLLSKSSIYIDPVTLAPLLSIAPERLYIYTDDSEQGLIQTMKQIFEERTFILPLHAFNGD